MLVVGDQTIILLPLEYQAQFNVTNNGSSDYVFNGDGFIGNGGVANQNDPILYLKKVILINSLLNASVLIHLKLEFLVVVQI